jgi:hypothetical protein
VNRVANRREDVLAQIGRIVAFIRNGRRTQGEILSFIEINYQIASGWFLFSKGILGSFVDQSFIPGERQLLSSPPVFGPVHQAC